MDPQEYRRLCSAPDVMGRPDIRATEIRLRSARPQLANRLVDVLDSNPLPRPALHTGGTESDFLRLDLTVEEIEAIHLALRDQEMTLVESGEPYLPELSFVTDLADRWGWAESSRQAP